MNKATEPAGRSPTLGVTVSKMSGIWSADTAVQWWNKWRQMRVLIAGSLLIQWLLLLAPPMRNWPTSASYDALSIYALATACSKCAVAISIYMAHQLNSHGRQHLFSETLQTSTESMDWVVRRSIEDVEDACSKPDLIMEPR
ncbi:hypothetical protein HU200_054136 [Digitaria exilis]|uniref:Uncharacterized protein n=1 Tax=Digitaria exilis TaxID=1010633 RepID=A0A835E5U4_9POAL|nr:hypothetical protein HU200_054136 [Digitaria exilis]